MDERRENRSDRNEAKAPKRRWRWLAGLGVVAIAAGALIVRCNCTGFERRWQSARNVEPRAHRPLPDKMLGRWEGTWTSETGKGGGKLRCVVTKIDEQTYLAWFRAKYWSMLTFESEVDLTVDTSGDVWTFSGEKDLGFLYGGVYAYSGWCDGATFHSTYRSSADHGAYRMTRVEDPGAALGPVDEE